MDVKMVRTKGNVFSAGLEKSTILMPIRTVVFIWIVFLQKWPITELLPVTSDSENLFRFHPCGARNHFGNCSHLCLPSRHNPNEAQCFCHRGFRLNSDQKTCSMQLPCQSDQFTCPTSTKQCMPGRWRCDGQVDCPDGSDEKDCPACAADEFQCEIGVCIAAKHVCDGIAHCPNGTDESDCCSAERLLLGSIYFPCSNGERCILRSFVCDGRKNCADGSDEPSSCPFLTTDTRKYHFYACIIVILFLIICGQFLFIFAKRNRLNDDSNSTDDRETFTMGTSALNYNPRRSVARHFDASSMYSVVRS